MARTTAVHRHPAPGLERLDAYRLARDFYRIAHGLAPHGSGLGDQLRRAAASSVLNLAEGQGRMARRDQAHFTAIARGSALECEAILDLLEPTAESTEGLRKARTLLHRVIQTTTALWRALGGRVVGR